LPYYARPAPGAPTPTRADVDAVRALQRELGVPESFEWIEETAPGLEPVARRAGLRVRRVPLMVLGEGRWRAPEPPPGIAVRVLEPGDAALAAAGAVQQLAFDHPGTAVGAVGPAERDAAAATQSMLELDFLSERLRRGLTRVAVAEDGGGPLACGGHQPVGGVSGITGIATLPSARRRGLGALVTGRVVEDARERGAAVVFLEAEDADVARIYGRLGFLRVGTACMASPA
jgi:ribosomal protein S18 acetylase RimI-like enzyme